MKCEILNVTPALASEWLEQNVNFRDPIPAKIDEYAALMKGAKWDENGESIKFNLKDELVDGQNRLMACVKAAASFTTVVVYGVKSDLNIDVGSKRAFAQWLKHHGVETYQKEISSALRALQSFRTAGRVYGKDGKESGHVRRNALHSNTELLSLLKKNPKIKDSTRFLAINCNGICRIGAFSALHYLFAEKDPQMADKFFTALGTGEMLQSDDAVFLLREKLIANRTAKYRMSATQRTALAVIAWNYWRKGTICKQLKWAESGPARQDFPEIE